MLDILPCRRGDDQSQPATSKFRHLNVCKRGDVRAPHKPLLVLYALGRLQGGANHRLIPYDEIDRPLTKLLDEFGPPRTSPHPELPF